MSWKIYTVIYLLLTIGGTLLAVPSIGSWNFASWVAMIEGILLAIGAFAFAYKKEWFNEETWKFIFIGILLYLFAVIIFYTTNLQFLNFLKPNVIELGLGTVLFSIVIDIPALIAIYKMGFPKKNF